jgi:peptidyl-prolyl cis-trans isomerase SurA
MHPYRAVCAALAAVALPLCLAGAPALAQSGDGVRHLEGIAAVVNDGIVLESELETEVARVRERMEREDQQIPPRDVLRERVLEELVLERIQLQHAARNGITVDDAAVNDALRSMADNYGTDLAGLRTRFERQGVPFDRLREDVRDQLIVSRLRERAVASRVQVSEQEVDDFMDRMERASDRRAEVRLRHILVGLPSDASTSEVETARQRAGGVVGELQDGADFGPLATRISDGPRALEGGDLGWRRRSELPGLFLDAIDGLEPGAIAGPLRSPNGFHVLKIVDRRGGQVERITEHRARHILLRAGDGDEDAPRERLAELRARIEGGASFERLARAHSQDQSSVAQGGDLGWIGPGDMPPAFRQVLQGLAPGQMSEPFRSPMGWHLVELVDTRERTDVEAFQRAQARQALYRRQVEEETQRWLRQLRDQAYVRLRLDS